MKARFWQKDDPLLILFFDKYHLNLMSIPREFASLGDVYMREGKSDRLSTPSFIGNYLEGDFELPQKVANEA